eukprot:3703312-Prymnesium_polylepis.1
MKHTASTHPDVARWCGTTIAPSLYSLFTTDAPPSRTPGIDHTMGSAEQANIQATAHTCASM